MSKVNGLYVLCIHCLRGSRRSGVNRKVCQFKATCGTIQLLDLPWAKKQTVLNMLSVFLESFCQFLSFVAKSQYFCHELPFLTLPEKKSLRGDGRVSACFARSLEQDWSCLGLTWQLNRWWFKSTQERVITTVAVPLSNTYTHNSVLDY